MDDGDVRRKGGILQQALFEPAERRLDFVQAFAGAGKHFVNRVLFEDEPEATAVDRTVSQDLRLFGLQDRFVHRFADDLDFFLDSLVLAEHGQRVPVREVVDNAVRGKDDKAHHRKHDAGDRRHEREERNPIALAARSLVGEYV